MDAASDDEQEAYGSALDEADDGEDDGFSEDNIAEREDDVSMEVEGEQRGALPQEWREHESTLRGSLESTLADLRQSISLQEEGGHAGERKDSHERGMLAVGEQLEKQGAMRMTDAIELYCGASGYQQQNSSRFQERLRKHLPVITFTSHSRKDGWMLMERTDNFKGILQRMLRTLAAKQAQVQRLVEKDLSRDEFEELEQLMTAEQKVLVRYLLVRIYGRATAEKRFGISNAKAVTSKVKAALDRRAAEQDAVAARTAAKRARAQLQTPAKGGRVAWEKDEATTSVFLSVIEEVQCSVSSVFSGCLG